MRPTVLGPQRDRVRVPAQLPVHVGQRQRALRPTPCDEAEWTAPVSRARHSSCMPGAGPVVPRWRGRFPQRRRSRTTTTAAPKSCTTRAIPARRTSAAAPYRFPDAPAAVEQIDGIGSVRRPLHRGTTPATAVHTPVGGRPGAWAGRARRAGTGQCSPVLPGAPARRTWAPRRPVRRRRPRPLWEGDRMQGRPPRSVGAPDGPGSRHGREAWGAYRRLRLC